MLAMPVTPHLTFSVPILSLFVVLKASFLLLPSLTVFAADDSSRTFLWEQANAQTASANTPAEYLKAANTYNRLIADGVHNGPLFINLANTLVMAGDGINAAAAYARAERHLGAIPETRHGILASLALQSGRSHADLPWSRTAFFWHFAFPCNVRVLAALAGWTLFWIGVFFRTLARRPPHAHTLTLSLSETCMLTGGLVALIFAASSLVTLMHERHDSATWGARVFVSPITTEMEDTP